MKLYKQDSKHRVALSTIFFCVLIITSSCRKLIEIDSPKNELVAKDVYSNDRNANQVMLGLYSDMAGGVGGGGIFDGRRSISVTAGVYSDEMVSLVIPGDILTTLYTNSLTNNGEQLPWRHLYAYIFRINAAIEGMTSSSGMTLNAKTRLLAECKFLRGFMYFYLLSIYGDVPLLLSTDLQKNSQEPRRPLSDVFTQVIQDLEAARKDLSDDYLNGEGTAESHERLRPNKAVATALLARVYLYNKQWSAAEALSSELISKTSLYFLDDLDAVFLKNSHEAIWQLQPVSFGLNTLDAEVFILSPRPDDPTQQQGPDPSNRPVYLSEELIKSFETGDKRLANWVGDVMVGNTTYHFPYKYKARLFPPGTGERKEYLMVFRLAEQYLIRAEARAEQDKLLGIGSAQEDINIIRGRAGLDPIQMSSKGEILKAILHERRTELFCEWGHRWFDLRRTGTIDEVMTTIQYRKGVLWQPYKALYPLPVQDIQRNPNLRGHQNPGYPEN